MVLQRFFIAALLHILENLNHNGRVPISIEIDFLVIGHFADLAARIWLLVSSIGWRARECKVGLHCTYLVSAKLEGRSAVIAPPKSGVFVNDILD